MLTTQFLTGKLLDMYKATEGPYGSPDQFECWLLYSFGQGAKHALEIGTWRGRSAAFIRQGQVDSEPTNTPDQQRSDLTCLDHFLGDISGGDWPCEEAWRETMKRFGLSACLVIGDMLKVAWNGILEPESVDFLFYDADHETEPTIKAIEHIHPFLAHKCRVVFHDAHWEMTRKALEYFYDRGLLSRIATVDVWHGLEIAIKP